MADSQKRIDFVEYCRSKIGKLVMWGAKGFATFHKLRIEDVFDCSGLVTCGIKHVTGQDFRLTYSSQILANVTPPTLYPQHGDLIFYGKSWREVIHVAVWMNGGGCITASGASQKIDNLVDAVRCQRLVEVRKVARYRSDFLGVHKNIFLEDEK